MGMAQAKGMTAKEAIAAAKTYFKEFYDGEGLSNVLLEELEYSDDDDEWLVTIGFDVGRTKVRKPSSNAFSMLAQQEISPIRESRTFVISDADGELVRMQMV